MPNLKYNSDQVTEMTAAFDEYIKREEDPTIAGFLSTDDTALRLWLTYQNMQDYKRFTPYMERAYKKQEAYILKQGQNGKGVPMAIFRLKQPWHGYTDRTEQDITSKGEKISFVNGVPRPGAKKKQRGGIDA